METGAVVAINVDLACSGYQRCDQAGIEVLKYLRLTESFSGQQNALQSTHCVMYSFRSLEALLRSRPSSAVICSRGTSFRRLVSGGKHAPLRTLARETAYLPEWIRILRGSITLPDDRHTWANWYAAWQMLRIHSLAGGIGEAPAAQDALPPHGHTERDALFVYGTPRDLPAAAASVRERASYLRASITEQMQSLGTRDDQDQPHQIALIDDQAGRIDGRTSIGWHEVHSRVLGLKAGSFIDLWSELALSAAGGDVKAMISRLEQRELEFSRYRCVLLDLRLAGERGPLADAKKLSGTTILEWLRSRWPTLPVIVTTASSRAGALKTLLTLGADAYWIKRGIDENTTGTDLAADYLELLRLVDAATSPRYQFLHRVGQLLHGWRDGRSRWWDDRARAPWLSRIASEIRNERSTQIGNMLQGILGLLRRYLHIAVMPYGSKDAMKAETWITSVIQQAGRVVECIHATDLHPAGTPSRGIMGRGYVPEDTKTRKPRIDPDSGQKIWTPGHLDGFACYLMTVRNGASHFGAGDFDWDSLQTFVAHLVSYVVLGPHTVFRPGMKIADVGSALDAGRDLIAANEEYYTLVTELVA